MRGDEHRYSFGEDFNFKESDKPSQRILRFALSALLAAVVLTIVLYLLFALFVNTDVEGRLRRENRMYEKLYPQLLEQEKLVDGGIASLQIKDGKVYQEVFSSKAPSADPMGEFSLLERIDSLEDTQIVSLTAEALDALRDKTPAVEQAFQKALRRVCSPSTIFPPMELPVRDISFSQIGASTGVKINPFLKAPVYHDGLDIILPQGSGVYATADGKVSLVEKSKKGKGNNVTITHPGGYVSRYSHLSTISVKAGESVSKGRKIGEVGVSGTSFAPHLHYEVLFGGKNLDPMGYIFASVSAQEYGDMLWVAANTGQSMD